VSAAGILKTVRFLYNWLNQKKPFSVRLTGFDMNYPGLSFRRVACKSDVLAAEKIFSQ
jgi:hypothetical protein